MNCVCSSPPAHCEVSRIPGMCQKLFGRWQHVSFHRLCQHCRNLLLTCDCRFHHDCVCVMNCRRRRSAGRAACPSPLMFTRHRAVIQRQRSDCQQITPQSPTESPTSDQQNCCLPRHVCIQVRYFVYLYPLAQGFSTCGP